MLGWSPLCKAVRLTQLFMLTRCNKTSASAVITILHQVEQSSKIDKMGFST